MFSKHFKASALSIVTPTAPHINPQRTQNKACFVTNKGMKKNHILKICHHYTRSRWNKNFVGFWDYPCFNRIQLNDWFFVLFCVVLTRMTTKTKQDATEILLKIFPIRFIHHSEQIVMTEWELSKFKQTNKQKKHLILIRLKDFKNWTFWLSLKKKRAIKQFCTYSECFNKKSLHSEWRF